MKKILLFSFVFAFVAEFVITIADSPFAAEKKAKKLTKVTLGASPLATWIPIWAAKEKGYFEDRCQQSFVSIPDRSRPEASLQKSR